MEKSESTTPSPTEAEEKIRNADTEEELIRNLPKERYIDGTYISFYDGFWLPTRAIKGAISFQQQFEPDRDSSDLILASFPKSGTTWLKALMFAIVNRKNHPLAESPLLTSNPRKLVPSLELETYRLYQSPSELLETMPRPRILSTHMPYASLPTSTVKIANCRIVYICRNPLDQFISQWHFRAKLSSEKDFSISLEEAFDMFCRGICWYGPIWNHVLGYWKASQEMPERVMFLKYEDLKENIVSHTKLLAEFLGFPFSLEEESRGIVEEVTRLCSFKNLKDLEVNKTGTHHNVFDYSDYFRKGEVGDSSNYLTLEIVERAENLFREKFEGSGLTFKFS